jgi:hypothetical protein
MSIFSQGYENVKSLIQGRWGSGAGEVDEVRIDRSTNTVQTIEYEHHEIHSGSHYNYCDYALGQASGAIIEFVLTTPNTTAETHLLFDATGSTGLSLELYEAPTGIVGGTAITPRNNNRNSLNTSAVTIVKDPASIATDGTRAAGFVVGANKTGGAVARSNEFVLALNTLYLVRITSLANSNNISWCAEWYEHTPKH